MTSLPQIRNFIISLKSVHKAEIKIRSSAYIITPNIFACNLTTITRTLKIGNNIIHIILQQVQGRGHHPDAHQYGVEQVSKVNDPTSHRQTSSYTSQLTI